MFKCWVYNYNNCVEMLIKQSASRYCNSLPQAVLSTINAQAQDFKLELLLESRVVGPNFSFEQKHSFLLFPESSHHKKYHGSCFMYLSEILSKLQTCEVTNLMTFSDGLLIYDFFI
jgi:hypothetical protein